MINGVCGTCDSPNFYNDTLQKCQTCPLHTIYVAGKGCKCPKEKPMVDAVTQTCVACPLSTPIWNGVKCVSCPENSFYVPVAHRCEFCVSGMTYDQALNSC